MSQHVYERRYSCRACLESDLRPGIDLGLQPLANGLLTAADLDKPELRIPLEVVYCPRCGLAQLTHVVDPAVLYGSHYVYRSGHSMGWYYHCEELAAEAAFPDARVLDIGCLDGVLLKSFADRRCVVTGCDPSAPPEMVAVYREPFGANTRLGEFDVITATNVFGHVDDARGFLEGVKANLAPDGTAIIECPWIVDLLEKKAWDTIYHEHLSYWGLHAVARVAGRAGLAVARVRHFPHLHGGTLRYYLGHRDVVQTFDSEMCRVWWSEEDVYIGAWLEFRHRQADQVQAWQEYFEGVKGKAVAAYGAAAKFNTLLNALPDRPPLLAIFDESPAKQGKYTPGWHIPVLAATELALGPIEDLVIGAPNWAEEIEAKARRLGFRGTVRAPWS